MIYVVEDDVNILEIETYALNSSGYETRGFENAKDFYAALADNLPELVILDIMLPDEDGLNILRKIRRTANTKNLPVIMLTAKSSEIDAVKGLDLGADDYITKPFGVMELISRVRAVLRRSRANNAKAEEVTFENITMNTGSRLCVVDGNAVELTFKEYELLETLLRNAGIVMKRDVLMERIWGIDFEGESRTLDMHVKTLRKKLGDSGRYIQTVRNVGYVVR